MSGAPRLKSTPGASRWLPPAKATSLEAVPGGRSGARRIAWQAILARRSRSRTALDAAAGDRPRLARMGAFRTQNDVRLWNLVSCAGGATGILYPRWRPLLDGPLFGAFGPFGMDGSVTPRAEMAGKIRALGQLASRHLEIASGERRYRSCVCPRVGDVQLRPAGLDEFLLRNRFEELIRRSSIPISRPISLSLDDIGKYPSIYLPYPVMLKQETVDKLRKLRGARAGTLISEGLPAYFGDHGHAGTVQPNSGWIRSSARRESYVEFTPDLLDKLTLEGSRVRRSMAAISCRSMKRKGARRPAITRTATSPRLRINTVRDRRC